MKLISGMMAYARQRGVGALGQFLKLPHPTIEAIGSQRHCKGAYFARAY